MSTTKGRVYENYLKGYCWGLGLKATRRLLSGSGLKKPYDVLVAGKLHIEAKRRLKHNAIVIQGEWLSKIDKNNIVVFTAGKTPGVPLLLSAVCKYDAKYIHAEHAPEIQRIIGEIDLPTRWNTIEVQKYKTIQASALNKLRYLKYGNKLFIILTLYQYLVLYGYIQQYTCIVPEELWGPENTFIRKCTIGDTGWYSSYVIKKSVGEER